MLLRARVLLHTPALRRAPRAWRAAAHIHGLRLCCAKRALRARRWRSASSTPLSVFLAAASFIKALSSSICGFSVAIFAIERDWYSCGRRARGRPMSKQARAGGAAAERGRRCSGAQTAERGRARNARDAVAVAATAATCATCSGTKASRTLAVVSAIVRYHGSPVVSCTVVSRNSMSAIGFSKKKPPAVSGRAAAAASAAAVNASDTTEPVEALVISAVSPVGPTSTGTGTVRNATSAAGCVICSSVSGPCTRGPCTSTASAAAEADGGGTAAADADDGASPAATMATASAVGGPAGCAPSVGVDVDEKRTAGNGRAARATRSVLPCPWASRRAAGRRNMSASGLWSGGGQTPPGVLITKGTTRSRIPLC